MRWLLALLIAAPGSLATGCSPLKVTVGSSAGSGGGSGGVTGPVIMAKVTHGTYL